MLDVADNFLDLSTGEESNLDFEMKNKIEKAIEEYAKKSLRTIGLVYKEINEEEMDFHVNLFCCLFPPLGVYLSHKKCDSDVLISFILMMFWFVPGVVWAYHKA